MNGNRTARVLLVFAAVLLIAALPLTALATAEEDANKELVTRWVQSFQLEGSRSANEDLACTGLLAHVNGNTLTLNQLKAQTNAMLTGSYDHQLEIISVLADGDLVAVHWVQSGKYAWPAQGYEPQAWSLEAFSVMKIVEGRIIEIWEQFDFEATD